MSEELQNLLDDKKVIDAVQKVTIQYEKKMGQFGKIYDQLNEVHQQFLSRTLKSRQRTILRRSFAENISGNLTLPHVVTANDYTHAAEIHLFTHDGDFQARYRRFQDYLCSQSTIRRRSRPFVAAKGYFLGPGIDEQVEIWRSASGLDVVLLGTLPLREEHGELSAEDVELRVSSPHAVYVVIAGKCSNIAIRQMRREIRGVLRTVFKSVSLLREQPLPTLIDLFSPSYVNIDRGCTSRDGKRNECWAVPLLLDAYYSNPTKKDSMDRRIRNALHLLVQADQQRHDAIATALCVTAIEALVCRKGSDLASTFAENIAALLEPESHARDDAVRFAKTLYDARSTTLHGSVLEHPRTDRVHARLLAAAVLNALLERREFQKKMDVEHETPDDLLNELKRGKWTPGQFTGVTESPVRQLWAIQAS